MNKCFVDTNLFIRYLTNDDPVLADRVEKLLDEASSGNIALISTELVMAETVWVLESSYNLTHIQITPLLRSILATPGLEIINGDIVSGALVLYEQKNIDFVDAYIAVLMEKRGIKEIYSYDRKHLSRVKTIQRKEP